MCGSFSIHITSALISFGASNNLHMLLQILFPYLFTIIGPIFGKNLSRSRSHLIAKTMQENLPKNAHYRVLEISGFRDK